MNVSCRQEGSFTVVAVDGEVDLYTSPQLRESLLSNISAKSSNLLVDLAAVSYMDSSGIATLVEALQKMKDVSGRLVLAGLSDRVREVFELARLHSLFEIADSASEVLASGEGGA